jgi:uncharacterized protein
MRLHIQRYTLFLLALLVFNLVLAQKNTMLWKVTSETTTVYVLGSIHLATQDFYPLAPEIEQAFAEADTLVVEADITQNQDASVAFVQQNGVYGEGDTLWDNVTPATKASLESFCALYEIPCQETFAPLKPWTAYINVSLVPFLVAGLDPNLGIDTHLLSRAHEAGKKIVEIENTDWQLELLSNEADETILKAATDYIVSNPDFAKTLTDAYLAGDAETVAEIFAQRTPETAAFTRKLIEDRNVPMADVTESYLKGQEAAMVVIGVGHMVGQEGVVAILEGRGYTAERVTTQE